MKKWLACLLAATAAFSMIGCNKEKGDTSASDSNEIVLGGIPEAEGTQDDFQAHYVDGMLHDVNVDTASPANTTFIKNQTTEYKIINGSTISATGAGYVKKQLGTATGCVIENVELSEAENITVDENSTYIFFGCEELFLSVGLEMPDKEKIGLTGYYIVTYGKNVFVQAYGTQGYQLAAICFLRQTVGFDIISTNVTIYEKDGSILPRMEITERPDFDYRQLDNTKIPADTAYGMGFTQLTGGMFLNTGTSWMHNVVDFLGGDVKLGKNDGTYLTHRGWFSDDAEMTQACFTARGDKEEYKLMVEQFVTKAISFMQKYPMVENLCIGQMDVISGDRTARCGCAACDASYEYYGDTLGGTMLAFLNDVSAGIQEILSSDDVEEKYGFPQDKEMNVLMLVYGQALRAPTLKNEKGYVYDENGKGVPMKQKWFNLEEDGSITIEPVLDEEGNEKDLVCGEKVDLFFAASAANYLHSFYEAENANYASLVSSWAGLGGQFYVWTYEVNYYLYMYPYCSWDSMLENMRYFKHMGANHFYYQGLYENANNAAFDKLRSYICSKGLFNVNIDYEALVARFFKYQFGPASTIMREYFNQVVQQCRAMESYTGGSVHSYNLSNANIWPEGLIRSWVGMIDDAHAAIASLQKSDPDMYEAYRTNIITESLFPRYVLCTTYANSSSFSVQSLQAMREAWKADFDMLGNTTHQEHRTISEVYASWGLN